MSELAVRSEAIGILAKLEEAGAATATALKLDSRILTYEEFENLGAYLGSLHRESQWLIGDYLNYGEKVHSLTYNQAAELIGLSEQTLMNYAYAARQIPPSRRRPRVSFSSHREVASLAPAEQKQWLKQADDQNWKRRELVEALRQNGKRPERARTITCPECGANFEP